MYLYIFLIASIGCLVNGVNSLTFRLPPNSRICLKDELPEGIIVTAEYKLSDAPGQQTDMIVTDSRGRSLAIKENIHKGRLAFSTEERDIYKICFISKSPAGQRGMVRTLILKTKLRRSRYV